MRGPILHILRRSRLADDDGAVRQGAVAVGEAQQKLLGHLQQPQHLGGAPRILRIARKLRLVDQLATHKILAIADHPAQRGIGRQQQGAVQLKLLHHRLHLGGDLPAQNGIHLLVNPFRARRAQQFRRRRRAFCRLVRGARS